MLSKAKRTEITDLDGEAHELALLREICEEGIDVRRKVDIVTLPGEPDGVYGLLQPGENGPELKRIEVLPQPRCELLGSLSEISVALERIIARHDQQEPVVYFREEEVDIIHDDRLSSRRLERSHLPLDRTPQLDALLKISGASLNQKALVRFLRVEMRDCLTDSSRVLLEVVKVMSSKTSQTAHGNHQHGKESIGRDIEAEVMSDVGEVPEVVTFDVRWCDDPEMPHKALLEAVVEIDPQTLSFSLHITPASQLAAEEAFIERLSNYLDACCDVPVINGSPLG